MYLTQHWEFFSTENLSIPFTQIQVCITLIDNEKAAAQQNRQSNHPNRIHGTIRKPQKMIVSDGKGEKKNEEVDVVVVKATTAAVKYSNI